MVEQELARTIAPLVADACNVAISNRFFGDFSESRRAAFKSKDFNAPILRIDPIESFEVKDLEVKRYLVLCKILRTSKRLQ